MDRSPDHRRLLRAAALILLLIAMSGPWAYDLIHVPAQFSCDGPNVRLQGDFCGLPFSLFSSFSFFFISPFLVYIMLFFLPIVTTLALLHRGAHGRLRTVNILAWTLAAIAAAAHILLQLPRPYAPPWGVLLYVIVAIVSVAFETFSATQRRAATA